MPQHCSEEGSSCWHQPPSPECHHSCHSWGLLGTACLAAHSLDTADMHFCCLRLACCVASYPQTARGCLLPIAARSQARASVENAQRVLHTSFVWLCTKDQVYPAPAKLHAKCRKAGFLLCVLQVSVLDQQSRNESIELMFDPFGFLLVHRLDSCCGPRSGYATLCFSCLLSSCSRESLYICCSYAIA